MTSLIVVVVLAMAFLLGFWFVGLKRSEAESKSLRTRLVLLLLYGVAFLLGEWYLVVLVTDLKWPKVVAFGAIACWGVLLASGSLWRKKHRSRPPGTTPK